MNPVADTVLVLGWGNLSRGDDALGPLFVAALRDHARQMVLDHVEFIEEYQLQVEHALDLVARRCVLLVDASCTCAAPFEVSHPQPVRDASFSSHAMSPAALLQAFCEFYREPPPPCTLLAIRGQGFELGAAPGTSALRHLTLALAWGRDWLASAPREIHHRGLGHA